jgi:hypothetical protein
MEQLNAINRLNTSNQANSNNQVNMTTHTSVPIVEANTIAIPIIPHNPINPAPVPINTTVGNINTTPNNQVINIPTATPKPKARKVVVKPKK